MPARPISSTQARHLGASKRFRYDDAHRMVQGTDRRGYSFHWTYDADSGRCIKSHGDDGLWGIEATYHGSWSTFTEADGGVWTYKHFPDGVLSHLIGPDGGVKQYVRDDSGRIVWIPRSTATGSLSLLLDAGSYGILRPTWMVTLATVGRHSTLGASDSERTLQI